LMKENSSEISDMQSILKLLDPNYDVPEQTWWERATGVKKLLLKLEAYI
jgi:hypothetical protein